MRTHQLIPLLAAILLALLALAGCAGQRTAAAEAEIDRTTERIEERQAAMAAAKPGSEEWEALNAELVSLRKQLVELQVERAKAMRDDTKDGLEELLWAAAAAVMGGAGGAMGISRHRNRTRQAEIERLDSEIAGLSRALDDLSRPPTPRAGAASPASS